MALLEEASRSQEKDNLIEDMKTKLRIQEGPDPVAEFRE